MMALVLLDNGSYVHPGDPGEPGYRRPRVSITDDEGALLAELVEGCRVLEIGTGLGVSTRYLASNAETVVTVDVDEWVQAVIWPDLAALDNVTALDHIPAGRFDAAFIDGYHAIPAVLADILAAKAVLVPGGRLILHDAKSANVQAACDEAGLRPMVYDTLHGIGVVRL